METKHRMIVVCLLLFATVGLCMQYAGADLWTYPTTDEIAANPGAYDGDQTLVFGDVKSVDQTNREIVITAGVDPELKFTVENVPPAVVESVRTDAGGIQVYGALRDSSRVLVADRVVVDYRHTIDRSYVYLTAALGGLLAAGFFLWHWHAEIRAFRFSPRSDR